MSEKSNKFQQLQKYIIGKNINFYDYTRFRIVELIKNEEFTKVYRAVFKNKITVILKSFENNELTINEVINELKLYHGVDIHPRFNGVTRQEDCLQNEPNGRPEIQFIVSDLKSLIVNCNHNISIHDLEITHSQNSFIIQDPIIYNSIPFKNYLRNYST
ncbi:18944_t:CDS:2 [Gigaspora margarita]|uniref:18944_t:CDS:1 n=1 Tax=Gigaspora margarita TaxID=4874 RepID=A0ABN7USS8_GIGMA|nr:18944_t:CDS:2 [Gigaspora margarita]